MKIDCISDLHGFYPKLEGGDLLIVAGDLTEIDTYQDYILFANWLREQDYKKKVFIAGNHDNLIQNTDIIEDVFYDCDYLQDSGTEFEGLKIWGSPWTLWFHGINPHCKAFTKQNEDQLSKKWALIPLDTDILITHSPAGVLDMNARGTRCGSRSLNSYILGIKPRLHVFGHIHECGGQLIEKYGTIICVNASIMDETYDPVNKPVKIEL